MRDLWDIQREFNDEFFESKGGWPREEQLIPANKDFYVHLSREAAEALNCLSFKMHRKKSGDEIERDNLLEELVDTMKFLIGWFQINGFTYEEFEREFKRKSLIVAERFRSRVNA